MRIPAFQSPSPSVVLPPDDLIDRLGLRTVVAEMIAAALGNLSLWVYQPSVESIEGEENSLESTPRGEMAVNTVLIVVINGTFDFWRIEAGTDANDWEDEENPLGRVADYGAGNQFIFRRIKMPAFI